MKKRFPRRRIGNYTPAGSNMLKFKAGVLWPDKLAVKMGIKFIEDYTPVAASGEVPFTMNYLNDIGSAGNYQPPDYDRLAAVYGSYYVAAFKIKTTIMNRTADTLNVIGYPTRDPASLFSTAALRGQALNQPYAKLLRLNAANTDTAKGTLSLYMATRKFYPNTNPDSLQAVASTGASPAGPLYYNLIYWTDGGANLTVVQNVVAIFYVVWSNLKLQPVDTTPA